MNFPKNFEWLKLEKPPSMLAMALTLYGTVEKPGPDSNPSILQWANNIGFTKVYRDDSVPWCGLTVAYVAKQTRWDEGMPANPLSARSWMTWGVKAETPMFGDVLVFWRGSKKGWSGHVGWYIGEDANSYCVYGGNQSDKVGFTWISKTRLLGARRCRWKIAQPASVRVIKLKRTGSLSTNEA
jgi:uncharacterized protein (TIGR02594 family)